MQIDNFQFVCMINLNSNLATYPEWGQKAPPYIINDGFKGKSPYKFFENCRLVKSIPFLKALR